jgi:hypothetical protein
VEALIDISAESILELFGTDEITQFTAKQLSKPLETFQDFEKKPADHKKIDFAEYLKLLEAVSVMPIQTEPELETPQEPEPKISRVLDFLRQFSSTPKSQSTKID